ncbi:MAG: ATP-grasp domain-containing protein [Mariniblastus sp.]
MTPIEFEPELNFLSELYALDVPEARLLCEYPSSNSDDTVFQNKTKYIIHDPFPPPRRELLKILGPHHLMCGWGNKMPVSSDVAPPQELLDHWTKVFGEQGCPVWEKFGSDLQSEFVTLFPHQSVMASRQVIDPDRNYELHSKEVIEKIACPQAGILESATAPCIAKLSHGYAGLGNFLIQDASDEAEMQRQLVDHWPTATLVYNSIIENITGDFGVQFYLRRDGSVVWLGLTEQHFDENKRWCGGTYSASLQTRLVDDFSPIILPTADHLYGQGYFGLVGIDILRSGADKFFLVDVNPRLTGITPFLMASRIFNRDGLSEGIYKASCKFAGTFSQLIDKAEQTKGARVVVLSAFEDSTASTPETICHLSISSQSQDLNRKVSQGFVSG